MVFENLRVPWEISASGPLPLSPTSSTTDVGEGGKGPRCRNFLTAEMWGPAGGTLVQEM